MDKKRCFIIQPFSEEKYKQRYEDIFSPAIKAAQVEPYRVDEDIRAENLILAIENGIKKANLCFAEITSHNRNVWYELGYATAIAKQLIIVCEESCDLPFDVRNRRIIMYKDKDVSSRHFDQLKIDITSSIKVALEKVAAIESLSEPVSVLSSSITMPPHTLTALVIIASSDYRDSKVTPYLLQEEMSRSGFNDLATSLAIRELITKEFIEKEWDEVDRVFIPTDKAMDWLSETQDNLNLKAETLQDDDIPF